MEQLQKSGGREENERGRTITIAAVMPESSLRTMGARWGSYVRFSRSARAWTESIEVHSMLQVRSLSPHSLERSIMRITLHGVEEFEMDFFY